MARAIFHKVFNFTDTKNGIGWRVKPADEPQTYPKRVIDAAVKAGAAKPVTTKRVKSAKE